MSEEIAVIEETTPLTSAEDAEANAEMLIAGCLDCGAFDPPGCECLPRRAFRACMASYHTCVERQEGNGTQVQRDGPLSFGRPMEEYKADFELLLKTRFKSRTIRCLIIAGDREVSPDQELLLGREAIARGLFPPGRYMARKF